MERQHITVSGLLAEMDPRELFEQADAVVEGVVRVSDLGAVATTVRGNQELPLVVSPHDVSVERVYKGIALPVGLQGVTVLLLGGTAQTLSMHVDSEATLQPGERVILFLARDLLTTVAVPVSLAAFGVFGGFQGKFTVTDIDGGAMVTRGDGWPPMPVTEFRRRFLAEEEPGPPLVMVR